MASDFAYPVVVRQISLATVTSADAAAAIALDDQLKAAVNDLCAHPRPSVTPQSPSSSWQRKCRQHAWAEAKQQIAAAADARPSHRQSASLAMNTLPITISSQ
jgi:UrcA family protein